MNQDLKLSYVGMFPNQRREKGREIRTLVEKTTPKTAHLEIKKKGEDEYHIFPEKNSVQYFFNKEVETRSGEFSLKEGWPRMEIIFEGSQYYFYQFPER